MDKSANDVQRRYCILHNISQSVEHDEYLGRPFYADPPKWVVESVDWEFEVLELEVLRIEWVQFGWAFEPVVRLVHALVQGKACLTPPRLRL